MNFNNINEYENNFKKLVSMIKKFDEKKENERWAKVHQESTNFAIDAINDFDYRMAKAFPASRGLVEFTDKIEIDKRLTLFFQKPLPDGFLWWFRGISTMHINVFKKISATHFLMNIDELNIRRIAARCGYSKYNYLYLENDKDEPTGLYDIRSDNVEWYVENFGSYNEEYALYENKFIIRAEEYDNGYAEIDGKVIRLSEGQLELRRRFLTSSNLLIAPNCSPINTKEADYDFQRILNDILKNENNLSDLDEYILSLPFTRY